jgi:hypothetical protein
VELISKKASELFCPERKGGYFCAQESNFNIPFLISQIGEPDEIKKKKYFLFSQEKAFRIYIICGTETSWQSRNEKEEKWGGAIRVGKYIFSFSGFPELVDEAVMIVLALRLRIINLETAQKLGSYSNNPYITQLYSSLPLCSEKLVA